ncbi:MAG TPA: hypothetical protein VLX92_00350 [Kofleriaceae bacterium]|nr:hypothetical protein [Kofleriaceae bacterium]
MAGDATTAAHETAAPGAAPTPAPGAAPGGGATLLHQLIAAVGTDPAQLAEAIAHCRHQHDHALWAALQHELGNATASKVRAAINHHVEPAPSAGAPGAERVVADGPAPAPPEQAAATTTTTAAAGATADDVLTAPREQVFFGIKVVAAAGVHASAVDECRTFIEDEIGKNDYAQQHMAQARVTVVIIPANVAMTDLPQFKALKGQKTFDGRDWSTVRGSGGTQTPDGNFSIAIAEENLVQIKGVVSGYPATYSIGMHEFAHSLEFKGLLPAQRDKVIAIYNAHNQRDPGNKNGTWSDTYASSNELEYFAQSTNTYFGKNQMGTNHNGRDWLQKNDPDMYQFLAALYDIHHDAKGAAVAQ